MEVGVLHDTSGDDPLEEFSTTLQKGDGSISLGCCIVRFIWLREGDDGGMMPRMDHIGEAAIEHIDEALWSHHKCPLDEFVVQPTQAGHG
jgi:hypothetical protein